MGGRSIWKCGQGEADRRLKGPMRPGIGFGSFFPRSRGSCGDPLAKLLDLLAGQRVTFRRHPLGQIRRYQPADQFAAVGVSRRHHGTTVTSAEQLFGRVDPQPGLLRQGPVAGVTPRLEHRLDVLEVVDPGRGGGCRWGLVGVSRGPAAQVDRRRKQKQEHRQTTRRAPMVSGHASGLDRQETGSRSLGCRVGENTTPSPPSTTVRIHD